MLKKILIAAGLALLCVLGFSVLTMADTVDITVESSDGYDASCLTDDDYYTKDYYRTDNVLTVTSDEEMDYLYIMWETVPGSWELTVDGETVTCGENGFLHELVKLPKSTKKAEIKIVEDHTYVTDIYGISGSIPDWVQDWETPYDEADILIFSSHSDDEILFMGCAAAINIDAEYRVQVAYLCDLSLTEPYRQHEQLNGLWALGIRHYPQMGEFLDDYPDDPDDIYNVLDYDSVVEYVVQTLRRFKPQVVITHDFDGEYGHPEHMVSAKAMAEALDAAADDSQYTDSAKKYGAWDVSKAYFHLYDENQIELDCRKALSSYDGETAIEVAKNAYLEHQSQQWMWFFVSDGYNDDGSVDDSDSRIPEINCSLFGLYRTTVGEDTGNDMMENIVSYDEQEKKKQEEETTDVTQETQESSQASSETTQAETESRQETTKGGEIQPETKASNKDGSANTLVRILLIALIVVLVIVVILIIIVLIIAHIKKKRAEERRRKRAAARRRAMLRAQQEAEKERR